MTADLNLTRFAESIAAEVAELAPDMPQFHGHSGEEAALTQSFIGYLEEAGVVADVELCAHADTEGRNRCRVSAYAVPEGMARVDLFVAVHLPDLQTLHRTVLTELCGRAARFFEYAAKKAFARFDVSPATLSAAKQINDVLPTLQTVRIHVLTDGVVIHREIEEIQIDNVPIDFVVYDIERIYRLSQTATSRSDIVIDFQKRDGRALACLEMQPRPPEYETYLAIFSGNLLFDLYEQFGQQLFEFNVRSFLQVSGKVNKGIRETLKSEPSRFMAYNNGLVATADEIEVGEFYGEKVIRKIVGLQIVNGAQTTASIHRAKKYDKVDLAAVSVPVKLTKVAADQLSAFVPLISRFANSQNAIQVSDLSANHEFHIELERISQIVWAPGEETRWFYERARGAYQVAAVNAGTTAAQRRQFRTETPPSQRVTKTTLARDLLAWLGRPHTVSLGAQKTFSILMSELPDLYPSGWKPDERYWRNAVARAILYRAAEKVVRQEKFPAYRANIVAYLIAYLSHICHGEIDFDRIWDEQGVSPQLLFLFLTWSHNIDAKIRDSARGRNVTEWCKKLDCWDAVRTQELAIPKEQPPELVGDTSGADIPIRELPSSSNATEVTDIDACMKLDAPTWAKISFWGMNSGRLTRVERGVAHTLSEYAASNWSRRPSSKQARVGAKALQLARADGILT